MTEGKHANCPECGESVAVAGPMGLCTACLLKLGMQVASARSAGDRSRKRSAFVDEPATEWERLDLDDVPVFLSPPLRDRCVGRFAGYDVDGVIKRNDLGVRMRATDPVDGRVVSLLALDDRMATNAAVRRRFVRAARAAAAVRDECLVEIRGVGEANGLPYVVTEHVSGPTLEDRIRRDGALRTKAVLRIGMQAAEGLAAAHDQGLIHGRLELSDILLERGLERVKLAGLGLARSVEDASNTRLSVRPTSETTSPEQVAGEPCDHRSDLFSLGAILYAMCAGRTPFRADSPSALRRRIRDDEPRPLERIDDSIPVDLIEIIERLLEKDPDDRIQSARELHDLLCAALARRQAPKRDADGRSPRRFGKRKKRWRPLVAGFSAIAGRTSALAIGLLSVTVCFAVAFALRHPTANGVSTVELDGSAIETRRRGQQIDDGDDTLAPVRLRADEDVVRIAARSDDRLRDAAFGAGR